MLKEPLFWRIGRAIHDVTANVTTHYKSINAAKRRSTAIAKEHGPGALLCGRLPRNEKTEHKDAR